ncbi:MAG: cation:proton antiporter [Desulfomonile sp.]|nr:cation:proton antiporter [Desulfomonile sp.]
MALENTFLEVTVILLLAALVGAIGSRLRQPLIVSFIAVGILVGPSGLHLVASHGQIELLAEIGIAILLFIVGLKLDLHLIRTMGSVALATGLGQVVFTSFFGFLIALGLGMSVVSAAYTAVALTFSSTVIIVKLLSDKREIDSLHGRIAVGFLIVQDIMVILAMIALSAMGGAGDQHHSFLWEILKAGAKGFVFLGGLLILMRSVIPRMLDLLARPPELLVLFSIAWAVALGAAGNAMGFSMEVGAFLAGVSLASTHYREAIGSRLVTLRDFLLLFFFINLGSRLDLSMLGGQLAEAAVFSAFVLIGNPLIVMIIMGIMGYRRRTGFLAGLAVAQISEFSLILASLGLNLGHIDKDTVGLITLVGIITIGLSTYMIIYSGYLYQTFSHWLSLFERKDPYRETSGQDLHSVEPVDVILFGLGRYGTNIAHRLLERGKSVIAVDFDPEILAWWRQRGLRVLYGDATDPEILEHLPLHRARWVVVAIPNLEANVTLVKDLRQDRLGARIVATAFSPEEAETLTRVGADIVLRPFVDAAEQAVDSLTEAMRALPDKMIWPSALKEVRLRPGSVFSGKTIDQIPLRSEHGVSILAVSRAGKSYFDPGPGFTLFPGDRLVLLGERENVERATNFIKTKDAVGTDNQMDEFAIGAVEVFVDSPWIDKTIGGLNFRNEFGASIISIRRGDAQITAPSPQEVIKAGDVLIVAGSKKAVDDLVRPAAGRVVETASPASR